MQAMNLLQKLTFMNLVSGMLFSMQVISKLGCSVSVSSSVMSGIVDTLVGAKKWKPDREELDKELKKLGLPKDDFKQSKLEEEMLLDPQDPVQNVSIRS